jgi:hypothetical protein
MRRTANETLMRRYLLGDTSQEERSSLEDQYFADADMFEELVAAEHDLIDSYVRGGLKESEKQRFELRYGKSPHRRARVDFASALSQVSRQAAFAEKASLRETVWAFSLGKRPLLRLAFAVAALVLVAGGSWLTVQNQRLRVELQQALAGQAELRRQEDALRRQVGSLEGNPQGQAQDNRESSEIAKLETLVPELTVTLTSGMARSVGGRQNTLILPPAESGVRLQLVLDQDEYAIYEAVIRTAEGMEIRRVEELKSQQADHGRAVVLRLPSKLIRPGDYIVTLNGSNGEGTEEAEAYSLRVVRR